VLESPKQTRVLDKCFSAFASEIRRHQVGSVGADRPGAQEGVSFHRSDFALL
jgi:hypothetical protein